MSDPLLIQKAIRQNSNDLFEFSKDLKSWGEDMKRKEECLKKGNQSSVPKKIPKVHKRENKVELSDKPKAPVTKIGATDYAAWDKFDADAELERLEDVKDDSDLTDECNESMYDEAIVEKEKGNKFVKNQDWEKAIKCYTKAIECYSYDPIFFANRALCYLKLDKYEEAENDCNLSIKLDDTYVKAYQRRAAARMKLNKLVHAEVDLQKVLIIEPNNKESKAELLKLSVVLKRDKEKPHQRPVSKFTASRNKSAIGNNLSMATSVLNPQIEQTSPSEENVDNSKHIFLWSSNPEIIEVKPVNKPPHLRSQKPLKRIEITEIDKVETKTDATIMKMEDPVKIHVVERHDNTEKKVEIVEIDKNESLKKNVVQNHQNTEKKNCENTEQLLESERPISNFKKQKSDKVIEQDNHFFLPDSENKYSCLKTEDLKVIEKLDQSTTSKDIKNTVNNKKLTEHTETNLNFTYPKNSVQFYSSWKSFKSMDDQYKYLKTIEPRDIPKLFLNSLDSGIFSNILEVLGKHFIENKDQIYDILNYFTEVKRFGAIVMFMSKEDKSNVWKLLDYIKENKEREKEDVDKLIEKFEL